jgi:hypothetical protein
MLSEDQIIKFQNIYKECFGKEISRKEALERGTDLISIIKLIYSPINEKKCPDLPRIETDLSKA